MDAARIKARSITKRPSTIPALISAPWTIAWDINWASSAIDEYICQENNQYLNHLKDDFGRYIIDHGEEYPKF